MFPAALAAMIVSEIVPLDWKGVSEMDAMRQLQAITVDREKGRALWHLGALLTFKALSEETDNQFWALEGLADRNMAVPLHAHGREEEVWYVLEGEITFTIGDTTTTMGPGAYAFIPRGVPHTFQVRSATARWFGIGMPGGLDGWFFETGDPARALTLPPPSAGPPDVDAIVASLRAYGTETLGPPPGQ
jgi:mannose-6-phosphate isomerase-like protein (cupin superfamily)